MLKCCRSHLSWDYWRYNDRERDRIERERHRRILYDGAGNVRLQGLMSLLWEEVRVPVAIVVGVVAFMIAYNQLVLYLSAKELAGERELDASSEAMARSSGKLKGDRYLVKPWRQIEDPDFLNIPSHAGKGVYKSKLFEEDNTSADPLFSERRRN
ncbi:hypothetical protein ERJ75_001343500 [Trypanosoma vivax]|uniref:Uncharacterized protein n=1 Tax=Trypanosoma vivax (strain Y486) TaxID=1055687 RepID=G0U5W9_TRYVY|nr:hypothetical protein TRVL_01569 [Trypanosoma vivax]KAH8608030.1 hypothetical protein ERJ75_001343500 [Trypanosoma vivax]CCC51270.1 conserved hypothetical protein [Trypanosoma vivax Y486]